LNIILSSVIKSKCPHQDMNHLFVQWLQTECSLLTSHLGVSSIRVTAVWCHGARVQITLINSVTPCYHACITDLTLSCLHTLTSSGRRVGTEQDTLRCQAPVAHACNPSYLGGSWFRGSWFKASPGK
jgi:hypothetical protein